jgi:hypothetical protein
MLLCQLDQLSCKRHVNVAKTEVVVFRHPKTRTGGAWYWQYSGQPVPRTTVFKYLGVILHETPGVSVAIDSLQQGVPPGL